MISSKPNIVLVITDDQGYGDLGCTGNPWLKTPNIDLFSRAAARCNDFHVSPLCTPTRGAIMTGRYPVRNGAWATAWGRSILRRNELTMPEVFAHNQYRTGLFGKWHLGDNYPYRPQDRGFDTVVAHKGGGVGQTPDFWGNSYFNDTYFHNSAPQQHQGYCTDVWFDEAMSFIEGCGNEPFFAYISTNAPHSPYFVADKYAEQYRNNPAICEPEFYGMISNIDENFGRLENFLTTSGLDENTLLIFMTDNGTSGGAKVDSQEYVTTGFNSGMRGIKASYYEGGHRVPFFARCPQLGIQDCDVDPMISHIDLLPTLVDLFELELPRSSQIDGISVGSCLRGDQKPIPDRPIFMQFHQHPEPPAKWNNVVLMDHWRLVNGSELFNLQDDPGQLTDIAASHPAIVAGLRNAHEAFWNEISASLAEACPHILGNDAENLTRLDAMDVMGDIAWDQAHILEARRVTGNWVVEIDRAGRYRISLRRWPEEINLAINAALTGVDKHITERHGATGRSVPMDAVSATLIVSGQTFSQAVSPTATAVSFEIDLTPHLGSIQATFVGSSNEECGAYYLYIERLTEARILPHSTTEQMLA